MEKPVENPQGITPAPVGGLTKEQIVGIIADALKPVAEGLKSLTANQKVLADTLAALPPATPPAPAQATQPPAGGTQAGNAPAALTAEQVQKLIADAIGQNTASAKVSSDRQRFQAEKMAKLPQTYRDKLGNDPDKWEAEAAQIQAQLATDMKSLGVSIPDVAAPSAVGGAPAAQLDATKLNDKEFAQQFLPKVAGAPAGPVPSAA